MTSELFDKILQDCQEFQLPEIEPFIQGDPFLDPDITSRIIQIRQALPQTFVRLYTNGFAMTPARVNPMIDAGLHELVVSLNTLSPDRYYDIMGLEISRTLANLSAACAYAAARRSTKTVPKTTIRLRMTRLTDTSAAEQREFQAFANALGLKADISGLFNYKGDIGSLLPVPRYGCLHLSRLNLLADGRTTLCCMDQDGAYGWGSVADTSVLELFRHEAAQRRRARHAAGERRQDDPCSKCNAFWPLTDGLGMFERARNGIDFARYRRQNEALGVCDHGVTKSAGSLQELASVQVELKARQRVVHE